MTLLLSLAITFAAVSEPSAWDCRELQDSSFSGLDVKVTPLPDEQVNPNEFFGVQIQNHSIPIPAVEYTEARYLADEDGISLVGISSAAQDVTLMLSLVDITLPEIGELSTYEQWLDYAYSIDRSQLSCDEFGSEMLLPTVALLYKGMFESDMCELTNAHRLNWGWAFQGDGTNCAGIRGWIWKVRFRVDGDRFFVVRTVRRDESAQYIPGFLLNNPSQELSPTPKALSDIVNCMMRNSADCLRSVQGIKMKDFGLERGK